MSNTEYNNKEIQKLVDMKINDLMSADIPSQINYNINYKSPPHIIIRVPGGWIYNICSNKHSSVFVPIPSSLSKVK